MNRFKFALVVAVACISLVIPGALATQGTVHAQTTSQPNRVRLAGTIAAFTAGSITVKTPTGDFKAVQLIGTTRYLVDGKPSATKPDFQQGQSVRVLARQEQDGSLTALVVAVGNPHPDRVRLAGTIADFTAASLTIRTPTGDVKAVQLTGSTKYIVNGQPSPTKPEFDKGQAVRVLAHQEQDGSLTALTVALGKGQPADRVRVAGTIADFTATSLTVKTPTGDVKAVQLTGSTKYLVNGKPSATRPEFDKGQAVRVVAHQEQDGSLTALVVSVGQLARPVRVAGTIADFTVASLTIKTATGDVKAVQLTGNTKYVVNGKLSPNKPDFERGQAVRVAAHQEQDGSLTALVVYVRTAA